MSYNVFGGTLNHAQLNFSRGYSSYLQFAFNNINPMERQFLRIGICRI